jgi:hypothetical protein
LAALVTFTTAAPRNKNRHWSKHWRKQGSACVLLDPKPSRVLAEVVAGVGGAIWSIGGDRQWDALPADPSELANQLVEVLAVDARTRSTATRRGCGSWWRVRRSNVS